jgi:hypothetical protein
VLFDVIRTPDANRATLGRPNAGKHERRKANRQNFTSVKPAQPMKLNAKKSDPILQAA